MKPIIVNTTCTYKDKFFLKGKEIIPIKENYEIIVALNKKGYINPLSFEELMNLKEKLNNKEKIRVVEEERKCQN